jgi:NADH-quinone oxidoreductase subunit H
MWSHAARSIAERAADAWGRGESLHAAALLAVGLAGITALVTVLGLGLVYAERKVAARFQCRLGPTRVGWHGTLQTAADALKLLLKEDLVPAQAHRALFLLAPVVSMLATLLVVAALPLSPVLQGIDPDIGVLYVSAVSGVGVLAILLAGWSSGNKWSMLGAMRAGAQIISYEVSATLALLVAVLFAGTLSLSGIVESQAPGWWIWRAHGVGVVAFLTFLTASVAEINRTPFDIAEGESELTGGFHTEYSGIRFSMFFLSEFVNMFCVAAMGATLFLGGWMPFHLGGWSAFNAVMDLVPPGLWFAGKAAALILVIMWFRWTFPRLRVDQLMRLEWKVLLPVGLANLMVAAVVVAGRLYFFPGA